MATLRLERGDGSYSDFSMSRKRSLEAAFALANRWGWSGMENSGEALSEEEKEEQEEEEGRNNLFLIIVRKEFIGPTTRNTDSTKAVTELDITIFYYCVLVLKQSDIFFTN